MFLKLCKPRWEPGNPGWAVRDEGNSREKFYFSAILKKQVVQHLVVETLILDTLRLEIPRKDGVYIPSLQVHLPDVKIWSPF